jgi:fused signal recognition particle receptor
VKGGSALSITYVTRKPILFVGTGQNYADLREFEPEEFVNTILE